jgi:hypothetical protein
VELNYPTIDEPATPEYVLEVFRDFKRFEDDGAVLSLETSVEEWIAGINDLMTVRQFARWQNEWWHLDCRFSEWRIVLKPTHRRTLGDVCQFIAARTSRPRLAPCRLVGRDCEPAAAFRTIRSILANGGASVTDVAPSTPLAAYTRLYSQQFVRPIAALAPGELTQIQARGAISWSVSFWMIWIGLLGGVVGASLGSLATAIAGGAICAGSVVAWVLVSYLVPPRSVEFVGLRTFRDLAIAVAEGNRRWNARSK